MNRAAAGAALLDKKNRGWFKRIKAPIRIESYTNCVLGQVYGDMDAGAKKLGLSYSVLMDHGFHTKQLGNLKQADKLSRAWELEVETRRNREVKKKQERVVAGVSA